MEYKQQFSNYNELLQFLRSWTTWHEDGDVYDLAGLVYLIGACLDNMRAASVTGDHISDYLDDAQKKFFIFLAEGIVQSLQQNS